MYYNSLNLLIRQIRATQAVGHRKFDVVVFFPVKLNISLKYSIFIKISKKYQFCYKILRP